MDLSQSERSYTPKSFTNSCPPLQGLTPNFILAIFNFSSKEALSHVSFKSNEFGLIPDSRYLRETFTVMMLIYFIYALKTYISSLIHIKMSHLYTQKSKAIVPMCWEHEKIFLSFLLFKFSMIGRSFFKMVESKFYRSPINNFQDNFGKVKTNITKIPWLQIKLFSVLHFLCYDLTTFTVL